MLLVGLGMSPFGLIKLPIGLDTNIGALYAQIQDPFLLKYKYRSLGE